MQGIYPETLVDSSESIFCLTDYEKVAAKWCPGCGDHSVLTTIQKLCRDEQLEPHKTVFVSGIGCSSRFPHYMKTYGFHGLHGRAFPVASGIKYRRPDLHVFVITGDGDCCSIGAGAWVHAVRYNMNMTVMLFNNETYGLTKNQVSPTSRVGTKSNTTPFGSIIPPINPVQTTLGISNVSFVAQTVDWHVPHLYATLKAAHDHKGFSFVHIVQRCPKFQGGLVEKMTKSKDELIMMGGPNGINLDENLTKNIPNQIVHNSEDMIEAQRLAADTDNIYMGLFYRNENNPRYDEYGAENIGMSVEEKSSVLENILDKYSV